MASCHCEPVAAPVEDSGVCIGRKQVKGAAYMCVYLSQFFLNGERKNEVDQTNAPAATELMRAGVWECWERGLGSCRERTGGH